MRYLTVLALLFSLGCSANTTRLEPISAKPVLKTVWHDTVSSRKYFDKDPQEFAPPAHSRATDELIVATSEGVVAKYQAANGDTLWSTRLTEAFHAGASVGNGSVFVASLGGKLIALDLVDGEKQWEIELSGSFETRATYRDGRLFIEDINNVLYALNASTGKKLWTHKRDNPKFFTIQGACEPYVGKEEVYCGFSDGHFMGFQIDSGDILFDVNLADGKTEFVDVDGKPIVDRDTIYVSSYSGGLYALNALDGETIWHVRANGIGSVNDRGSNLFITLASREVARIDKQDGTPMWSYKHDRDTPLSVTPVGEYLFATTSGGAVYVFDAETGYVFERWIGNMGINSPATFAAGRIYFVSDGGEVTALQVGW